MKKPVSVAAKPADSISSEKPSEQNAVSEVKEQAQQAVQHEVAEPQQQQQQPPVKNYPSIKIDIVLSAEEIQAEMEHAKVLYETLESELV